MDRFPFDARWRARALAGAPDAIAALAEAGLGPLHRFSFYRVARDAHLCEEVVQETLVRAIRDLERYDPARSGGRILPWLCGLAKNEIRRVLRREAGTARLAVAWERLDADLLAAYARIESEPLAEEHLEREETRELVAATLSQLPEHYRDVLEAKYVADTPIRQLAEALGETEKAVESRLARARAAFRAAFLALTRTPDLEAIR